MALMDPHGSDGPAVNLTSPTVLRSYMVPMGLGSAVNTCVGNALGSGDGRAARRAAIIGLACAVVVEATMAAGVLGLGEHLVRIMGGRGGAWAQGGIAPPGGRKKVAGAIG